MTIPEIHVAPQVFWTIGPFEISPPIITALIVSLILITLAIIVRVKISLIPNRLQLIFEMLISYFLDQLIIATGSRKRALKLLPFVATIFLFLVIANQFTLIPFVSSIVLGEVLLFKVPAAHYSLPIALIIMGLGTAHILAFLFHPIRYIGNYIKIAGLFKARSFKDFFMAGIDFFLGLMDIVGELAKFISVSTRLFGNLFAGEIVVGIISGLLFITQFVVPIPFIVLGILSGLVQAFVFTTLTMIFMSSTLNSVRRAEEY
ncbi:MAG: ATP synthase F0 subunit alpha, F-type H+-transporting ATPase subunit a [Candidatus Peregrinibacteria bacterium GW2011_GWE2_39_6]|nr:MAG: ATP synthase F0 subunit alpha, F-type H+-transporting ATPase subunit a [Candidatus Peregrinibacteria bacterium GW2011_GWF2_39_17]KKR26306.1 MAG: ATP synthase F0 subunit alpha, F-type H+-transporting ATPase subunit a [Candidatus Peregrinibacteria bacterium GW2011_GWE2_39_6]HCW32674.1 hypothetical protein [Candidatus Peregrinibacteria bacterium]